MRHDRTSSTDSGRGRRRLAASLLGLFLFGGCASWDPFAPTPGPPPPVPSANREYRIGVPDRLALTVWQHPDVSGPLLVRNDGKVSVPLMGDIQAAGRTPTELAEKIRAALSELKRLIETTA